MFGQQQINDNINKKFLPNDKILESLAAQLEEFNSVIKNQLSTYMQWLGFKPAISCLQQSSITISPKHQL